MYVISNGSEYLASVEYHQLGIVYTKDINRIRVFTSPEAARRNIRLASERVVSLKNVFEQNVDDSF